MRWTKRRQTDEFGRKGWSHFSDDDKWEISDEGPRPWTLLRRNVANDFTYYAAFKTLAEAKRAAIRGNASKLTMEGD